MKSIPQNRKQLYRRNTILGIYSLSIFLVFAIYTTITVVQYVA